MQRFYSNGKLLITGEYVVLDGAEAFALPTKFGQYLDVEEGTHNQIVWTSYDSDNTIWFEDIISFQTMKDKQTEDDNKSIKNTLVEILHEAYKLNPSFLDGVSGYKIQTRLTFPKLWGLGTSSTLINNLAQFLQIDAFELLKKSFGGSGYDIACAQCNSPILYQLVEEKPTVKSVSFNPEFKDKIYFVYLNQKQNSRNAIANYYNKQVNIASQLPFFNSLTQKVINAVTITEFSNLLEHHEVAMSHILESATIKESLFEDFPGTIKSLGAWGGDFVMVVTEENPKNYFKERGFDVILTYSEMIL
ncbi:MAG: GYDIA family GHMP kinase [Limnohabitans sp.]|nr:GYDIA family GHMP kinase [Limnohabitans sp.]